MYIPPYRISLSGGGIKGFAHVGVLEVLEQEGLLSSVREYIGISAGALCALSLCIGSTIEELRKIILLLDFGLIRDIDPDILLNFTETFGIDTGAGAAKLLSAILRAKKLDPDCTFAELEARKLGPSLRVFATNMNSCRAQEFSAKVSPDIPVRFAVQASLSIPIYFTPLRHPVTKELFIDGGVCSPTPFAYLSDEEKKYTLSIVFGDSHKPRETIDNFYDYVSQLYYSSDYEHSTALKQSWPQHTISVPCGGINTIDFEASKEAKEMILDAGRKAARDFLSTPAKPPVRRFSIA